jgi:hypothetical protein
MQHRITGIRFQLDDWDIPLSIDFEFSNIVVVAGKNAKGKTLLLQSIHRLTECIRNCYSGNELSVLEFKQWVSNTPIKLLEIDFSHRFSEQIVDTHAGEYGDDLFKESLSSTGLLAEVEEFVASHGVYAEYDMDADEHITREAVQKVTLFLRKGSENSIMDSDPVINYNFTIEIHEGAEISIDEIDWHEGFHNIEHRFSLQEKMVTNLDGGYYPFQNFPPVGQWQREGLDFTDDETGGINYEDLFDLPDSLLIESECRSPITSFIDTNRLIHYDQTKFIQESLPIFIRDRLEDELINYITGLNENNTPQDFQSILDLALYVDRGDLSKLIQKNVSDADYKLWLKICNLRNVKTAMKKVCDKFNKDNSDEIDSKILKIMIMLKSIDLIMFHFGKMCFLPFVIPKELELQINKPHLSSGEEQMRSILFQFADSAGCSLLLIDEPEISLHIEWQRSLIDYIKVIRSPKTAFFHGNKLNFPIIISTHSPDIIYHHPEIVLSIPPISEE